MINMIPHIIPLRMLVLLWLFCGMAFAPPLIFTLIQQPVLWLQTPNQRLKPATLGIILGTGLAWTVLGIAVLLWH